MSVEAWLGTATSIIAAELWSPSANTLHPRLTKLLDEAEESQFPVVACVDFEISQRDGCKLLSSKSTKMGFVKYDSLGHINVESKHLYANLIQLHGMKARGVSFM